LTNIPGVTRTLSYNKSKYRSPVYFVPPSTFVLQCRTATYGLHVILMNLTLGYHTPTSYTSTIFLQNIHQFC